MLSNFFTEGSCRYLLIDRLFQGRPQCFNLCFHIYDFFFFFRKRQSATFWRSFNASEAMDNRDFLPYTICRSLQMADAKNDLRLSMFECLLSQ